MCAILSTNMFENNNGMYKNVPAIVYAADVSDIESFEVYQDLYDKLPEYRKIKIGRLRNDEDRYRSVAAGTLLIKAYRDFVHSNGLKLPDEMPEVSMGHQNKPSFTDSPFFFNLSHSGKRVMCVMAACEVGCDVEYKAGSTKLAKRFFANEEYGKIVELSDEADRNDMFTRIWTLKESVVKALGDGLSYPLNAFSVYSGDALADVIKIPEREGEFYLKLFEENDGYKYACCSRENAIEDVIKWIRLNA